MVVALREPCVGTKELIVAGDNRWMGWSSFRFQMFELREPYVF